jgi:thiamine-phosphate diphosphorylase
MRPLPRLHAYTDARVLGFEDFAVRAAAIAAAGPGVAIHARNRSATAAELTRVTQRLIALARPPQASVFVNARPDIATALGAQGVQLSRHDLPAVEVRRAFGGGWKGWIGVSVHSVAEANEAWAADADFLVAGNVYETTSHAGRPPAGPELVARLAKGGLPVIAIGGITADRAREVQQAGAYGVAAISALWESNDPAAEATRFLQVWGEAS